MLLSICQNTFQSLVELEAVDSLRVEVRECYAEITKTSERCGFLERYRGY